MPHEMTMPHRTHAACTKTQGIPCCTGSGSADPPRLSVVGILCGHATCSYRLSLSSPCRTLPTCKVSAAPTLARPPCGTALHCTVRRAEARRSEVRSGGGRRRTSATRARGSGQSAEQSEGMSQSSSRSVARSWRRPWPSIHRLFKVGSIGQATRGRRKRAAAQANEPRSADRYSPPIAAVPRNDVSLVLTTLLATARLGSAQG